MEDLKNLSLDTTPDKVGQQFVIYFPQIFFKNLFYL